VLSTLHADPTWKRKVLVGGLALAICPPIVWMLAMGYRQQFGVDYCKSKRLGTEVRWPEWTNIFGLLVRGLKVWSIIMLYLAPGLALPWLIVIAKEGVKIEIVVEFFRWIVEIFVLLPLGVTIGSWNIGRTYDWFHFSTFEAVCCLLTLGLGAFLIPAGFIQLVAGGKIQDAFPTGNGWRLVSRNSGEYCLAWVKALCCCFAPFTLLPLALLGWPAFVLVYVTISIGVFWSYVASVKIFCDMYFKAD